MCIVEFGIDFKLYSVSESTTTAVPAGGYELASVGLFRLKSMHTIPYSQVESCACVVTVLFAESISIGTFIRSICKVERHRVHTI